MSAPPARRGRPAKGRGRKSCAVPVETIVSGDDPFTPPGDGVDVLVLPKRGRGRPPKNPDLVSSSIPPSSSTSSGGSYNFGGGSEGAVSLVPNSLMRAVAKRLPSLENDGEMVQCADCGKSLTFWQFRLHNIQWHVNTAATTEEKEDLVMDHKYFSRRLNEFKRLTKMIVFPCPRTDCKSSFKSTLGLAYHMNTCGRSKEELDAVLMECEICKMKLTLPNMQWHRKTHEVQEDGEEGARVSLSAGSKKRRSAVAARKSFRKAGEGEEGGEEDSGDSDDQDDKPRKSKSRGDKSQPIMDLESNDYTVLALDFLDSLDAKGSKCWDDRPRVILDPFLSLAIPDNPLISPEDIEAYLPSHKNSVEFKVTTTEESSPEGGSSGSYHRLNWFEGESVEIPGAGGKSASIHHSGGSVLSMAWHPSGKLLAVSIAPSLQSELDSLVHIHRKSCVQIYRRAESSSLSLHLLLGVSSGYPTHLQWSTFNPDIMDSYNPAVESCFDDIEIYARIGYLAMATEDHTVRILSLGIQDLKVPPNYEYRPPYKIKVYRKTPEIELKLEDTVTDEPLGNAVRFDWHETNKIFAVGYANGAVAIFDLDQRSPLLLQKCEGVTVINPIWTFQAHRLSVRGILFDPKDSRYLVTCGQDRLMKVWDLKTRSMRDNKRTGICLDTCWVRGWMHQVASFENIVAYQSSMHNYVRIFQTGSGVGRPTSAEIFNVTSLDFWHGLTAQGTEDGRVTCTYFDWFWRECDYERNRKKKNLAVLSSVEVDKSSYRPFSGDDFSVEVRKLGKHVISSKLYQRLGVNDEEGLYGVSLEAKFGNVNIYDKLPDIEGEEEGEEEDEDDLEGEEDLEGLFVEDDEFSDLVYSDAINSAVIKAKDGLLPVYDVRNPEGEPRLNISLARKRPSTAVPVEGLEGHQVEEYIRFHNYLRVNKVAWSPTGDVLCVGYRNGLITLLPTTFDSIFQT